MFQVMDKKTSNIFTVYNVKSENGKTEFLLHDGVGWFWDNMKEYKPI
jgi:hypothetical protein